MAKRRRRRRKFRRYLRGAVEENTPFGSLGAGSLVKVNMDSVVNERTFVSSVVAQWGLSNHTPTANAGPYTVGIAHSDYSATEILEYLNQSASWNETDQIGQEIAKRKIKRVGTFPTPLALADSVVLNDGKAIRTKLGWILTQGQTLAVWVQNVGSASVTTTTPQIETNGYANLWPQ